MPDPTPARTVGENGVPIAYHDGQWFGPAMIAPTHVAFPRDEAEALLKVARVARDPLRTDGLLTLALMDLDAARKQRGSDAPV